MQEYRIISIKALNLFLHETAWWVVCSATVYTVCIFGHASCVSLSLSTDMKVLVICIFIWFI